MSENTLPPRVSRWTQKLLDLSLRNRLLNVRDSKCVLPLACRDVSLLEDKLASDAEVPIAFADPVDNLLVSSCTEAETKKRLKHLFSLAKTDLEESGVNTLFLALGFLNWKSSAKDAKTYRAPLVLLPVKLVRKSLSDLRLARTDEDATVNATLIELLRTEFHISVKGLDPVPEDDHGVDLTKILDTFFRAVAEMDGWSVTRDVALGQFSFGKFVMWKDLTSRLDVLQQNPLVSHLISGDGVFDDGIEVFPPEEIAQHLNPMDLYCPLSADSSQLTAVLYSQLGKTFVLHGPPGTGKSQTITNLIAHNLAHGRRVLFVSEKKAALDVVHARLTKIGLRPFCLELHSNKSGKADVLAQFAEALNVPAFLPTPDQAENAKKLDAERQALNAYAQALHKKHPNGLSAYDCLARAIADGRRGDATLVNTTALTDTKERLDTLRELAVRLAAESGSTTPDAVAALAALKPADWSPDLERRLAAAASDWSTAADKGFFARLSAAFRHRDLLPFLAALKLDAEKAKALAAAVPESRNALAYLATEREATSLGLASCRKLADATSPADTFESSYRGKMLDEILSADPLLAKFNGANHDESVKRFREFDAKSQQLAQEAVIQRLSDRMPFRDAKCPKKSELGILRHECEKKMRHKPVRQLLAEIPTLAPQLKPCFLMSPLSVAQYLSPDAPPFDLIVFDEASQIPVWDAIGVIARGKQLVCVGDPKQMPPTNFFQKGETDDLENEDDNAVEDLESILDECLAAGVHSSYLNWHYRSRHESLIAFSNRNYYDSRLYTFPSAATTPRLGVRFEFVADGVYDRKASRTNEKEAAALVDYVFRRISEPDYKNRSVGVVTFSQAQKDLIEDLFERRREKDPSHEDFFSDENEEPFFVKNLENVQGDERDVILFSIGYAPDAEGKFAMNFGPLNRAGGERRLNVAVTRAKEQVVVFSSIHGSQIDLSRTSAVGAAHLQAFLDFAEKGVSPVPASATADAGVFPAAVAACLRDHGWTVDEHVGASGYRIDLAVRRKEGDGYLLAIECDGPSYAAQRTARDRDELRASVLKSLGWHVTRLWSVDWALDRKRAEESLLGLLEALNAAR